MHPLLKGYAIREYADRCYTLETHFGVINFTITDTSDLYLKDEIPLMKLDGVNEVMCIDEIYIDKAYRNQGLATALLNSAISFSKRKHVGTPIVLVAEPLDSEALSLSELTEYYIKRGFNALVNKSLCNLMRLAI